MNKIAEKRGLKTPDAAVGIALLPEEIAVMSNLPLLAYAMIGKRGSADAVLTAVSRTMRRNRNRVAMTTVPYIQGIAGSG